jgi:hypothetical protein
MNTKVMRITLFSFILLLFSISITALDTVTTSWNGWGNSGQIYLLALPYYNNIYFASQSPFGNTNFTKISKAITNTFVPVIDDFNSDGRNEIVSWTNSTISLISDNGITLSSITVNGSMCGSGGIVNKYDNQYRQVIGVMRYTSGIYNIYTFNISGGTIIIDDIEVLLTVKTSSCVVLGGLGIITSTNTNDGIVYIPYTDGNILKYNTRTGDKTDIDTESLTLFWVRNYLGSGMSAGRLTTESTTHITFLGEISSKTYIIDFNTQSESYTKFQADSSNVLAESGVAIANIGDPTSNNEYIVELGAVASTNKVSKYFVFDDVGTQKLYVAGGSTQSSHGTVGDVNQDGLNEYCFCYDTQFWCYDYTYTKIINVNFSVSGNCQKYVALGEYVNNNSYMEVITREGVWGIPENNLNMTLYYNFSMGSSIAQLFPIEIKIKETHEKDILYVSGTNLGYFTGNGTLGICGDGTCIYPETVWSCVIDCVYNGTIPNGSIGNVENQGQCLNDSWCISGDCDEQSSTCRGRTPNSACSSDSQCSSGDCLPSGICANDDNVDIIQRGVEFLGFRSVASKLLLAFMIIITLAVVFAIMFYQWSAVAGAVIGFILGLCVCIFVFGWIAVWFLIVLILLIIAIVAITMFWGGGNN